MGWTTLYITGKSDFKDEVRYKLEAAPLDIMPGYTGSIGGTEEVHDLYWIDDETPLRRVKEAIGSKLIWKYRLKFYNSLEEFIESQNNVRNKVALSKEDLALLAEMKAAVR